MTSRATLGLTAGALALGLVAGLVLGGGEEKSAEKAGPGPTKTVAGVPVGYAQSKDGAIQAALGYEGTLGSLRRSTPAMRVEALKAMAAENRSAEILKSAGAAYEFFDQQFGSDGIVRGAVLGYRVKAYSSTDAEIELWVVSVVGRPESVPVRSGWSTRTVRLRWVEGDWKLDALPGEVAGPTPQDNATPSEPIQVVENARTLEEVRFATAALP